MRDIFCVLFSTLLSFCLSHVLFHRPIYSFTHLLILPHLPLSVFHSSPLLLRLLPSPLPLTSDSQLSGSLTQTLPSPRMSALRPIASLSLADRKVDLVGVIKTSSTPQKSKGPDYFTTATLIDETSQSEGLPVTFFNPVESHLPQLGPAGCVAYVQNVSLSEYEESLHASGHERSRVVCFSKGPSGEVVSSSRDKVTSEEMQRVEALLEWVAVAQPLAEVAEDSTESPSHTSPPPSHPSLPPTTSLSPPLFLTLTFHPTWRLSSLETIKSCEKVPSLFRVRVKVLQVLHPLQQCCQLRCSQCKYRFSENYKSSDNCPRCTEKRMGQADVPKLRFMFCFSLLVSDSTGQMCLHLSDTNADEFFQNLQPANLTDSSPTRESLLEIFRSLTGSYDPFLPIPSDSSPSSSSFRPWVDCCIQTYPSRKGKQFRVVDTWYVGQAM